MRHTQPEGHLTVPPSGKGGAVLVLSAIGTPASPSLRIATNGHSISAFGSFSLRHARHIPLKTLCKNCRAGPPVELSRVVALR